MPELLLELRSEEIPARMQARAGEDLARLLTEKLTAAGLAVASVEIHTGLRRLAAVIADLPARTDDVKTERKGPRVGAPEKAVEGFLRSAGLESLDQCEVRKDGKGEFHVAVTEKPGRDTLELLGEIVPAVCEAMPWPKSMRWGERSERWVRPLRGIVCLFGGEVAPVEWAGIAAGDTTAGHRVMGPGPFTVTDFASYKTALEGEGHVRVVRAERRTLIAEKSRALCGDAGLALVEDERLLEELAGLAEWPVPLLGEFDPGFLELPPEVIRLTMAKNQKYFAVRDPAAKAEGALAPRFVAVADLEPTDGGAASAAGYARVLSARLSDAKFFWDEDRARTLESRVEDLKSVVFHRKLGSLHDKAQRVSALARELAPACRADPELAARAGLLAKADLTTQMVQEFTDLQGVMGAYYAAADGEDASVAAAVREHYRPQGPTDPAPHEPVCVAVALADKLDTLVGFWAIDEKPTGSGDPYALRRAALGVIRIVLTNGVRLGLASVLFGRMRSYGNWWDATTFDYDLQHTSRQATYAKMKGLVWGKPLHYLNYDGLFDRVGYEFCMMHGWDEEHDPKEDNFYPEPTVAGLVESDRWKDEAPEVRFKNATDICALWRRQHEALEFAHTGLGAVVNLGSLERDVVVDRHVLDGLQSALPEVDKLVGAPTRDLLAFFADRLKVALREDGVRHDLIDAVFALGEDDLVAIAKRVDALQHFMETDEGETLLAGARRAMNIVEAEEKKGFSADPADFDPALLQEAEEKALAEALDEAAAKAGEAVAHEDYEDAMAAIAPLRPAIDAFFDAVKVNAEDEALRRNRLLLLGRIRAALGAVADFSKIGG